MMHQNSFLLKGATTHVQCIQKRVLRQHTSLHGGSKQMNAVNGTGADKIRVMN